MSNDLAFVAKLLDKMERDLTHWKKFGCCPPRAQRPVPAGCRQVNRQLNPKRNC